MSLCSRCRAEAAEPTLIFFKGRESALGLCPSCVASLKTWLQGEELETLTQLRARVPWSILGGLRSVPVALGAGCAAGFSVAAEAQGWVFQCATDCDPGLTLDTAHHNAIPFFPAAVAARELLSFQPFHARMGDLVSLTIKNTGPRHLFVRSWNLVGIREEDMATALKDPAVASFLRRRWPNVDFQERSTLLDAAMERIDEIARKTRAGLTPKEREVLDLLQRRAPSHIRTIAKAVQGRLDADASRLVRTGGVLTIDPGTNETIPAAVLDHRTEAEAHQDPKNELACPGFGPGAKGPRCCERAGDPGTICDPSGDPTKVFGGCGCACHAGEVPSEPGEPPSDPLGNRT